MEKREVKLPDYNERFNTIERLIVQSAPDHEKLIVELKAEISRHNLSYPAEQIQGQINLLRNELTFIPKVIPVKNYHHFDVKTKPFIIAATPLLIVVALITGLNIYLWRVNSSLQINDLKYRMIRQNYPQQANSADSFYTKSPVKMEKQTIQLETEALERSEAAALAEQKEKEAKDAKDKLNELQKHKHKK